MYAARIHAFDGDAVTTSAWLSCDNFDLLRQQAMLSVKAQYRMRPADFTIEFANSKDRDFNVFTEFDGKTWEFSALVKECNAQHLGDAFVEFMYSVRPVYIISHEYADSVIQDSIEAYRK